METARWPPSRRRSGSRWTEPVSFRASGYPGWVARGDHPQRTPFYGATMMIAAFVTGSLTARLDLPTAAHATIIVVAVIVGLIGFGMTFRDLS